MTGQELFRALQRQLARTAVRDEVLLHTDPEGFYEALTDARDTLLLHFALAAPLAVASYVTLTQVGTTARLYEWPEPDTDPLRILEVWDSADREYQLTPSAQLGRDHGHYAFEDARTLRLAPWVEDAAPVVRAVRSADPIDSDTATAIGLPRPFRRALVLQAALNILTQDEQSDGRATAELLALELDKLERLYENFDAQGGVALRQALLHATGELHGETL